MTHLRHVYWIPTAESLPRMNHFVLVFRSGGRNKSHEVGIGYRQHRYGTRDEWEWIETGMGSSYWGKSIDGSEITYWAEYPQPPA